MGMQKYASRSFRGKLDEIKLFDKALTDSEVEELFNLTDIENMELINEISLYPNPCGDILHIEGLADQYDITLYNINGQIIEENIVNKNNNSINTSKLKKGVYFLRLFDKERIVIKKVIKN